MTADGNSGGNFNRYWYANNNPYKFTDPDGRWVQVVGGVIGAVVGGVVSYREGNSPGKIAEDTLIGGAVGVLSTLPGGGVAAAALRAGLASAAGDAATQAIDSGGQHVDGAEVAAAGITGAVGGGIGKKAANALVPNRKIGALLKSSPLVKAGRAIAGVGSETKDAPKRAVAEAAGGAVQGGATVGAALSVRDEKIKK